MRLGRHKSQAKKDEVGGPAHFIPPPPTEMNPSDTGFPEIRCTTNWVHPEARIGAEVGEEELNRPRRGTAPSLDHEWRPVSRRRKGITYGKIVPTLEDLVSQSAHLTESLTESVGKRIHKHTRVDSGYESSSSIQKIITDHHEEKLDPRVERKRSAFFRRMWSI